MAQVEFQYNGVMTIIPCKKEQKMEDICSNFINKANLKENEIYYFYDGKGGIEFDKNLTFNQMANQFDKTRKKMSILVYDYDNTIKDKSEFKLKNIVCPECKENIKMEFKNYEINLFECKNNHSKNNIIFDELEKTQVVDLTKIKCGVCKEKNKSITFNNVFYKCADCNINLCPLCKTKHNKNHNIFNYDKINYICSEHNEPFTNYCKTCNKDLCFMCDGHNGDKIISLGKMMKNKKELMEKLEKLKNSINIFNENINKIIEVLNKTKEKINTYYKLEESIFNNYDKNERNYELLYNINELIRYNYTIINDVKTINNENNYINKFRNIFNIYKYRDYTIPKDFIGISNILDEDSKNKKFQDKKISSIINSVINIKKINDYLIERKDRILNSTLDLPVLKPYLEIVSNLTMEKNDLIIIRKYIKNLFDIVMKDNNHSIDNFLLIMHKELLQFGNRKEAIFIDEGPNNFDKVIKALNQYYPSPFSFFKINDIINYAKENKSIISNLFGFIERICLICPNCHDIDFKINFRTSITFDLENIIKLKCLNSKLEKIINLRDFRIDITDNIKQNTLISLKELFKYFMPELKMNLNKKYVEKDDMIGDIFKKMMNFNNSMNNNFNMNKKNKIFFLRDIFNLINEKKLMNNNFMGNINSMMNNNFMGNINSMMNNNFMRNINSMMNIKSFIFINDFMNPPYNRWMMMNNDFIQNPNMSMEINNMMDFNMAMNNNMIMNNILFSEKEINKLTTVDLKEAFELYKFYNNFEKHIKCECGKEFLIFNKILSLPEYLIINVEKSNNKFLFPEKIDLTEEVQINLQSYQYRLISAIKISQIMMDKFDYFLFYYSQDKKKWFEFDNENIKECNFDEVLFVGDTCCLIYEKTN